MSNRLVAFCVYMVLLVAGRLFAQPAAEELLRAVIPKADTPPVMDGKLTEYGHAFFAAGILQYRLQKPSGPKSIIFGTTRHSMWVYGPSMRNALRRGNFFGRATPSSGISIRAAAQQPSDASGMRRGALLLYSVRSRTDQATIYVCPGYENAIPRRNVQVEAQLTEYGLEYEFKLPWSNFPDFHPATGQTLHLDTELSYSDGVSRSFRSFVFGSPLSVEQPANLARVMLVDTFARKHWALCGPVMMPIRVDTPWQQQTEPQVHTSIAIAPNRMDEVAKVEFQLLNTNGNVIATYPADKEEVLERRGNFVRRTAHWPTTVVAPGAYHTQAVVYDHSGAELTRVTPRLVSVNMDQGY